jgi:polyphosphate kinase
VDALFSFFESTYKAQHYRQLSVAPFNLRKRILKLIREEARKRKAGGEGAIFIKVNNLTDPEVIQALYRASRAGVAVRLIVRGMFSLVPGVSGLSENIRAIRIVDRFLEHSRIFVFGSGADGRCYLSSADLMTRNLDQRVEIMFPIFDARLRHELLDFMEIQWRDTVKARVFDLDGGNQSPPHGPEPVRAQWAIYEHLAGKGRRPPSTKGKRP